jgi:hypothetical protein
MHTCICLSLDFFHRVFTKRRWRHKYVDSVSPKLSHWVIGVFHGNNSIMSFIFSTGFLKDYTCHLSINCPRGSVKNQILHKCIVEPKQRIGPTRPKWTMFHPQEKLHERSSSNGHRRQTAAPVRHPSVHPTCMYKKRQWLIKSYIFVCLDTLKLLLLSQQLAAIKLR